MDSTSPGVVTCTVSANMPVRSACSSNTSVLLPFLHRPNNGRRQDKRCVQRWIQRENGEEGEMSALTSALAGHRRVLSLR